MTVIGMIGLGTMGGPITEHLARSGNEVVVFDKRPTAIERAESHGARGVESAKEVGRRAEIIFLSLPGPSAVETVVAELEPSLDPDGIIVDLTTTTPETTRGIAEQLSNSDSSVLGSPVSGGAGGASDGSLTAMVSGDREAYETCREYIDLFAEDIFYIGSDPGHGPAVKLLNNYLSFTALCATSEAMILGEQMGLDSRTICEIFNVSSGRNTATEEKFPEYILEGHDHGFTLELMDKDIRLLLQAGEEQQVPLLLASVVRSQIAEANVMVEDGDLTDVYEYMTQVMVND